MTRSCLPKSRPGLYCVASGSRSHVIISRHISSSTARSADFTDDVGFDGTQRKNIFFLHDNLTGIVSNVDGSPPRRGFHISLFGKANQSLPRPFDLITQTHADNAKPSGAIPTQKQSYRQSKTRQENRDRQRGKRFALEQQCPVDGLFPGRPDRVEGLEKKASNQRNSGETDVGRQLVGVARGIVWYRPRRCLESLGIAKFEAQTPCALTRCWATTRMAG